MQFKAQYNPTSLSHALETYWRTVQADDVNEAMKKAKRMARKDYRVTYLAQLIDKE